MDPYSVWLVFLIKSGNLDRQMKRHRVKTATRQGTCEAASDQEKGMEQILPKLLRRNMDLPTRWFWTSSLQNCESVNSASKPSTSLWQSQQTNSVMNKVFLVKEKNVWRHVCACFPCYGRYFWSFYSYSLYRELMIIILEGFWQTHKA